MEFLQGCQYWVIADNLQDAWCDTFINQFLTMLGFLHICLQPYYCHVINAALTKSPKYIQKYDTIKRLCLIGGGCLFVRFLLGWADTAGLFDITMFPMTSNTMDVAFPQGADTGKSTEWLRGEKLCTFAGKYHLAWSIPMADPSYYIPGAQSKLQEHGVQLLQAASFARCLTDRAPLGNVLFACLCMQSTLSSCTRRSSRCKFSSSPATGKQPWPRALTTTVTSPLHLCCFHLRYEKKGMVIQGAFLFLTGPVLAAYITPNLMEQASIWCFFSISQICSMLFLIRETLIIHWGKDSNASSLLKGKAKAK